VTRVLFVSNGHGEQAIAARIASDLAPLADVSVDHLCLVGDDIATPGALQPVGPRRSLPSGGLIAMGNVRNLWRDLRGGLLAHTLAQLRFLHRVRARYDAAVAVGDVFALWMTRRARASKTVFVGTAKSVYVAPYGRVEMRIMRTADAIFVRDEPTARYLNEHAVPARSPGNVIVDLFARSCESGGEALLGNVVAIFPGSRQSAYDDAAFACAIVRDALALQPALRASLSIAPGLDAQHFAQVLQRDGWDVRLMSAEHVPFVLALGERPIVTAWTGSPAALLEQATVVLGQAGTANEAAAARGIPIAAFERRGATADSWYRRRQSGLLDGALQILGGCTTDVAQKLVALLADEERRVRMGAIGRERMGPPGGARAIAACIRELLPC